MDGPAGLCVCRATDAPVFGPRHDLYRADHRALLGPRPSALPARGGHGLRRDRAGIRNADRRGAHPVHSLQRLDLSAGSASAVGNVGGRCSRPKHYRFSPVARA
jgi:hypothetical protein